GDADAGGDRLASGVVHGKLGVGGAPVRLVAVLRALISGRGDDRLDLDRRLLEQRALGLYLTGSLELLALAPRHRHDLGAVVTDDRVEQVIGSGARSGVARVRAL